MSTGGANIRERTQLFANARPYVPNNPQPASMQSQQRSRYPESPFQYSDAMNDHTESQQDEYINTISSKISVLKDLSLNIGKEANDTSGFLTTLNEQFDSARVNVKNTMHKMIRTADQSGISWRTWLLFIALVIFCFWVVMFL
ncbi:Bet1 protein [Starmerella bacillaris]|uniref:Bet1 protein n=1 Tax=Starmerella bacillaris TaxID=1247836 RepID=A0AAV5RGU4_STABA|nr:Bet1 protein [Starmerella bacillaris]